RRLRRRRGLGPLVGPRHPETRASPAGPRPGLAPDRFPTGWRPLGDPGVGPAGPGFAPESEQPPRPGVGPRSGATTEYLRLPSGVNAFSGAVSQDGRRVLILFVDRAAVWDLETRREIGALAAIPGQQFSRTALSADGQLAACAFDQSPAVRAWDVA